MKQITKLIATVLLSFFASTASAVDIMRCMNEQQACGNNCTTTSCVEACGNQARDCMMGGSDTSKSYKSKKNTYGRKTRTYDATRESNNTQNSSSVPTANNCVKITKKYGSGNRYIKNKCSYRIAVWFCDEGSKYGCDSGSSGKRFDNLEYISSYSENIIASSFDYKILYFACRADKTLPHITNNKRYATRFGCKQ